jgi:hypothetical protein
MCRRVFAGLRLYVGCFRDAEKSLLVPSRWNTLTETRQACIIDCYYKVRIVHPQITRNLLLNYVRRGSQDLLPECKA